MSSLPQLAAALQQVLRLDPLTLDATTGFCQRRSKCTAALFVQTTVLGWAANPAATLAELAGVSAACGVTLSPQALEQRLRTPAAARLLRLPTTVPLLQRFPGVLLLDSTTVKLPDALAPIWAGCGGSSPAHTQAVVKLSVRLDLVTGRLDGPAVSAGRQQDRATVGQHHAVPAGALRIADRGFWSLSVLQHIREDSGHFLSYLPVQTVLSDPDTRTRLALLAWLEAHAEEHDGGRGCDHPVLLGVRHQLPARLLAWQESPATSDVRADRLRAHARHKGERPSRRALERTGWTLIVTSLAPDQLTAAEARALLDARWQIELLFKCWKQLAALDAWRTANPQRIQCEVLAKAIGCVLQHWLVCCAWQRPDRSFTHALTLIRAHILAIALALADHHRLLHLLAQLTEALARLPGIQPRSDRPATFQRLANAPNVP